VTEDEDLRLAVSLVTRRGQSEEAAEHRVEVGVQHPRSLRNRTLRDESRYWYPSGAHKNQPPVGHRNFDSSPD
jgi:hypothetical protein